MFSARFEAVSAELTEGVAQRRRSIARLPATVEEAIGLLWCPELGTGSPLDAAIIRCAANVKRRMFGDRIYPIVPLYVTSICSEHCTYCNFRVENKGVAIERLRLADSELMAETSYLIGEKGFRTIELVYATDPRVRADAICRHVELVKKRLEQAGGGVVGINCEALDEDEYRRLVEAGLDFAVLWQETYDRQRYLEVHPGKTKKTRFEYRLDAFDRMISAGLTRFGIGVLSGLSDWRKDWGMLLRHQQYLLDRYGAAASILGTPRMRQAAGAPQQDDAHIPTTEQFLSTVALHNLLFPETLAFVSTRENWETCVTMAAGGGSLFTLNCSTIPGGYSLGHKGYQFPTETFDAPVFAARLLLAGLEPVFRLGMDSERTSIAGTIREK
jgi:2-iminoacetate synthase